MAGERARQLIKAGQDATAEMMRALEETGELQHLHGRPLDLRDDSPDWFIHSLLKREGVSLPAIERGKDLDAARRDAEKIVERLRRRHAWLARTEGGYTAEQARAFNETRARTLDEYRTALTALNKAILTYNLTAPPPLHRHGVRIDHVMDAVTREIPPLDEPAPAPAPRPEEMPRPRGRGLLRTLWHRPRTD